MAQLKTVAAVFEALGGAHEIIALIRAKRTTVYMWRASGRFPAKTYLAINGELRRRGHSANPSLWGMVKQQGGRPRPPIQATAEKR